MKDNGNYTSITGANVMGGMTGGSKWGIIGLCGGGSPYDCGEEWQDYCCCVRNCFYDGSTSTEFRQAAWDRWSSWQDVKHIVNSFIISHKYQLIKAGLATIEDISSAITGGGISLNSVYKYLEEAELVELFEEDVRAGLEKSNMYNPNKTIQENLDLLYTAEKNCRELCDSYKPGGGFTGGGGGGGGGSGGGFD